MTYKQLRKLKIDQICQLANVTRDSAKSWLDSAEACKIRGFEDWMLGRWKGNYDTAKIVWDVSEGKYLTKLHKALR